MGWTSEKNNENKDVIDFGKEQDEWNKKYAETFLVKKDKKSRMCLGIWGDPKNGKTGLALDFPDREIYVLDWDRGVESTWKEHYDATDRIKIHCPIIRDKSNVIDIHASERESLMFVNFVRQKIEEGDKPIFVFDGVDTWHESCLLKVSPDPRKVAKMMPWQYGERNKTFFFLMEAVYALDCDVIYITHKTENYLDGNVVGYSPIWKNWGGKLEQEIRTGTKSVKGELQYVAQLVASRTNGNLVGTTWVTREGRPPNVVWNGIPQLREGNI
jgi:hypothetical protein